jgi:hypothetical protein
MTMMTSSYGMTSSLQNLQQLKREIKEMKNELVVS